MMRLFFLVCCSLLLTACGFHLQQEKNLAPPLHRIYLQAPDPYGQLARSLKEYLKQSHVHFVNSSQEASTILVISQDEPTQELLSVSGTQQTRQYNLRVTVTYSVTTAKGATIIPSQTLTEARAITIQSNQILGSSNEANLFYQQIRRTIAYNMVNRLASNYATHMINQAFHETELSAT